MENAAQAPDIIQPAMEEIPDIVQPELSRLSPEEAGEGKFKKLLSVTRNIGHLATRGSQTALVLLQVSPANEVVRFGAFGAGEAMTHSPVMGALTYGLSTLGVEVAGTLAGAPLLDTGPSERITNFLNRKLSRVTADRESEQREYSRTTKLSTAFIGGTVPAMALEKLEDPTRTPEHNRRFGLWTSAWLAGACAVQGAAMSEGIDLASNNTKLAAGAAGVAAAGAAGGWLKRRLRKNNEAAEYGLYESLLSENTKKYAQQQGLDQEEFASALKDSETARAVVSDGKHEIPLLVPLKHMKWLNED
ncbi:MAG TPA: hypothetical protein VNG32_02090, partial [Candidatus Dormibacteraeota bacterium]|nr:hypothetical protein [Candidatus Dormibacteraeota bacterium]